MTTFGNTVPSAAYHLEEKLRGIAGELQQRSFAETIAAAVAGGATELIGELEACHDQLTDVIGEVRRLADAARTRR